LVGNHFGFACHTGCHWTLLNEFLKEHQKVQRLEAALAAVNERLKAQDAKIDKVNAKVDRLRSPKQRQHFTISRHASPRGGFLFPV